jgi:hypothetical protein
MRNLEGRMNGAKFKKNNSTQPEALKRKRKRKRKRIGKRGICPVIDVRPPRWILSQVTLWYLEKGCKQPQYQQGT